MTGCDTELLALAARWHCARRKRGKILNAWRDAADASYGLEGAANDPNVTRLMQLAEATHVVRPSARLV